jgi:hypothetical protein
MRSLLARVPLLSLAALAIPILLACSPQAALADNALTGFVGGTLATSASDQLYGWEFDVLSSVNVSALGVGDTDNDGLAISHDVGIFRVSDQSLVTSTTVPSGVVGNLDSGFRYTNLGFSVLLVPDRYVIAMTMPVENPDTQIIVASSASTAPQIAYMGSRFGDSSSLVFPTMSHVIEEGLFGPNFQFQAASVAAPEPGTLALVGIGLGMVGLVSRRRA